MRIASGVTDQYVYFVAVDSANLVTRKTGLSSFTVYRSRNGGAAAAFTTPTINETDSSNMPGVYELLLDEDMTIDSGDETQEIVLHITHAGMAPVTRTIELYRPKITAGYTLSVESDGDLTKVNTLDGHTAQTGDTYALANGSQGFAAIDTVVDAILVDTAVIGAAGAGLTAVPWNSAWDAEVQSEVADALAAYDPPTKAELDSAVSPLATSAALATVDNNVDSILTDTGTSIPGLLSALESHGDSTWATATGFLDAAGVRTAVGLASANLDTQLSTIDTEVGAIDTVVDGIKAVTDNLPDSGALSSLATASALSTVDGNVDSILEDTGTTLPALLGSPAGASVSADIAAVKAQTAAIETDTQDLQTQVGTDGAGLTNIPWNSSWDAEVQSEVADALNAYDPPTNAEMEARTLAAASYATATALQTVDDEIATLDGVAAAIKAKTDDLTFTVSGVLDANITYVNETEIGGDGGTGTEFGPV